MCGIVGAWFRSAPPGLSSRVAAAQRCLAHRGPDDAGDWREPSAALALKQEYAMVLDHPDVAVVQERNLAEGLARQVVGLPSVERDCSH